MYVRESEIEREEDSAALSRFAEPRSRSHFQAEVI